MFVKLNTRLFPFLLLQLLLLLVLPLLGHHPVNWHWHLLFFKWFPARSKQSSVTTDFKINIHIQKIGIITVANAEGQCRGKQSATVEVGGIERLRNCGWYREQGLLRGTGGGRLRVSWDPSLTEGPQTPVTASPSNEELQNKHHKWSLSGQCQVEKTSQVGSIQSPATFNNFSQILGILGHVKVIWFPWKFHF